MTTKKAGEYFCTRPRIAAHLMGKGFEGELTTNPFVPDKVAWIFPRTPELERELEALRRGEAL